jgi:hypothetical protein
MQEILPPEFVPASAYDQLTKARRSFVDAFVMHGDPRKAYRALYPKATDADATTAYRWMRDPLISAAIAERMAQIAAQTEVTLPRVIAEIGALAFASMGNFIKRDDHGNPILIDGLPIIDFSRVTDEQWVAVREINIDEEYHEDGRVKTRKVKFALHDKGRSLDQLMKRFGAYAPQQVVHSGEIKHSRAPDALPSRFTAAEAAEHYARLMRGEE